MKLGKKQNSFFNFCKSIVFSKTFLMFLIFSCVMSVSMFAAGDTIEQLDDWGTKILSMFSSVWVKAIACVALIIEAIGMVVSGQQGGGGAVIKKFAPWLLGTIILLCASSITDYFYSGMKLELESAIPAIKTGLQLV